MIAKLIVWDVDRETARRRMLRALDEFVVEGPATLIPFHSALLRQEEFIAGGACHELLAQMSDESTPIPGAAPPTAVPGDPAAEPAPVAERHFTAEVGGRRFEVALRWEPPAGGGGAPAPRRGRGARAASGGGGGGGAPDEVVTAMQGTVLRVLVEVGQEVGAGTVVAIVEAMKMENEVTAHRDGTVKELRVAAGQGVSAGEVLAIVG